MTDNDLNNLLAQLCTEQHTECINSLLAGNDTGCFSIEQYAERYHKMHHNDDQTHRDGYLKWLAEISPRHLKRLGCVEVKTGVWAKKE